MEEISKAKKVLLTIVILVVVVGCAALAEWHGGFNKARDSNTPDRILPDTQNTSR